MNTAMMLENIGHHVFSATSARRALDILRRGETVDLVITDEAMPQMRGSQLADTIRTERPGLPRLEKPFSQHDLARIIAEVMLSVRP